MALPELVPYENPLPPPATGNRWLRGLKGVLRGQLPGPLEGPWDRLAVRLGWRTKVIRRDGLAIRVRRLAVDERFLYNILDLQEYTPAPHYTIRPTDTVIDIGGNLGTFTLVAAKAASQGRVISVEPMSDNFALLQRNVRRNGFTNVTAIRAAVVGTRGPVTLFIAALGLDGEQATGSHSIYTYMANNTTTETLPGITLADLFAEHHVARCHLLKIDCEGAEHEIVATLPSAVFQRIDRIVMEWHTSSRERDEKRRQVAPLVTRLQEEGFTIDAFLDSAGFRSGFLRCRRILAGLES